MTAVLFNQLEQLLGLDWLAEDEVNAHFKSSELHIVVDLFVSAEG